jgi:hypothetical protein
MGLGLITNMESGIRRAMATTPSPYGNPTNQVDDARGCMMVLDSMCVGHGGLTTGGPDMLSLAVTLRKLLTAGGRYSV